MDEQNPKQSGLNVEVPETDLQLSSGSITSDVKLNSGTDNNVDVEQEAFKMDDLSLSNPVKYLATYNSPHEWILDQREAEAMQKLRDTAMPEQASKIGSIAYAAGEFVRKTGNMARDFSEYAAGVDAYLLPNANKDIAERAYKNMKKLSVQAEQTRADYVAKHGVDPDIYGPATNIMEVARDMVLTAGVAGAARRSATKAAFGYASSRLAPSAVDVAERFAVQQGKKVASGVAKTAIAGETFMRETGDRATQQAAQYMEATGDYDLKYYDPTVDLALNTGVSAINSAIEMSLGIERIVPDMLFGTRGVGRAAEEFIRGYISERSEEFLQNFFDQGGDVLSGYRDNISLAQAWSDSASAGWIGGIFGSGTAAGMYYLNRRRMIRQLQENGIEKDVAAKFVDKVLQDGINKTLSNMSSTVELRTKEGPAYEKMKSGIKNALLMQGWNEKMVDPQTGEVRNIDSYVETFINNDVINKSISEALSSGLSIDDWLDVAQFAAIDNVLYVRPLGTVEDIQRRIDEQDAIIKRQTELKKTGADKPGVLQEARTAKAILQKLKANKLLDGEIERVSIEEAKTPEIVKEIDTATTDAAELGKANTAADFVGNIEGTDEQKTKRLGNAVMKRIFKDDKRGFEAVMTKPEYANVRAAINSSAAKIFDYIKAHRAYGVAKDLYDALKLLPTVKSGNFISTVNTPDLTGQDPVARNAFLYNFVFNDAHATSAFIDAYLIRAEESITNQTKVRLGKKDIVGQAFKAMDALMQTQADVAGLQYTSIYSEDGSVADPNVAAVVASWQNLFVEVPEQRRLPQRLLEQFDLADENARLDEIYPEYDGDTIEVDGRIRPVYNSEGKRINKSAEALRNFWRWFGDSKAVDEQGRPLVVYHGTNARFDTFDARFIGSSTGRSDLGLGFYFSDKKTGWLDGSADWYGNIIMPVYLKMDNPFVVPEDDLRGTELGKKLVSIDPNIKTKLGEKISDKLEKNQQILMRDIGPSTILNLLLENKYDGVISDNEYVVHYPNQIKSVENLGYYNEQDPRMLYQIGYASMRGEMVGDYLDANMFAHTGEGPNVHGWGNYFLADPKIDKKRYYDKFYREGPKLKYDGKEIDDLVLQGLGIFHPDIKDIIKYNVGDVSVTKKQIMDKINRQLKHESNIYQLNIDTVIDRVKDTVGAEKARKIIADMEKMLTKKGGPFMSLLSPFNPVAYPEIAKIQKKYFKGGKGLIKDGKLTEFTDDYVTVYNELVSTFGGDRVPETSYASWFANRFSDLNELKRSAEAVKKLDFDKFTGRTGLTYKGEDFRDWFTGKLRRAESRHGKWVSDIAMHWAINTAQEAIENSLKFNTGVMENIAKEEEKSVLSWTRLIPEVKQKIVSNIEKFKDRQPNADVKAVKKFLFDFIESPEREVWPSDGLIYQDWYKDESTLADRDLIDLVVSDTEHGIENPDGLDSLMGLMNSIRAANALKRSLDETKSILKNVKKEDLVFKPRASMYKTDKIPEDNELLHENKKLTKQPKEIQDAIMRMILENNSQLPFLSSFLDFQGNQSWDVIDALFGLGDKQGAWDQDLMNDLASKMISKMYQHDWILRDMLQNSISAATREALRLARIENRPATVRDLIEGVREAISSMRVQDGLPGRDEEWVDLQSLRDMLIERVSKHGLDTKLEDIADEIRTVNLANNSVDGDMLYSRIRNHFMMSDYDANILRRDPTINARPDADATELTAKLLLKYGIRGIRYRGGTDKLGFVTFEPTPTTERLYQLAYAGAGVDYDRPSLKALGTGQNTASHGWGLYYALDPIIAEKYMAESFGRRTSNLSLDQEFELLKVNGKPLLDVYDIDVDRQLLDLLTWKPYGTVEAELDKRIAHWEGLAKDTDYKFKDFANKKIDAYKRLKADLFKNGMSLIKKEQGQVHEVDIPEMDVLLDEQQMLIDQPEFVQKKIWEINDKLGLGIKDSGIRGGAIYSKLEEKLGSDKAASQYLDKEGIKGITYYGRDDGRCFVIFNDKSVKVLRKKFDELGNQLFSLNFARPKLVVTHGISAYNLDRALELGGLPAPSLAITRADDPLNEFGAIKLVGTSDMIDPTNPANEVYDRDIWSQTFPKPEYKNANMKQVKAFRDKFKNDFIEAGDETKLGTITYLAANSANPGQVVEMFADSDGAKVAYIKHVLGDDFEVPTTSMYDINNLHWFERDEKFRKDFDKIDFSKPKEEWLPEYKRAIDDLVARGGYRAKYASKIQFPGTTTVDKYELQTQLNLYKLYDTDAYTKWAEKQVEELIGKPRIRVGRKLLEWNAENITNAMIRESTVASEKTFGTPVGKVIASAAKRFESLEDIKEGAKQLKSREAANGITDKAGNSVTYFAENVIDVVGEDFRDEVYAALPKIVTLQNPTPEDIKHTISRAVKHDVEMSGDLLRLGVRMAKDVADVTRSYFEAKPQRTVSFSEFAGAIVPTNPVYDESAQKLADRGLTVVRSDDVTEGMEELSSLREEVLFQGRRATINGVYDPELGTILIGKSFNGTTLPHEMAHYWLDTIFKVFKQAQAGKLNVRPEWMAQKREMFAMLGINENQTSLTRGQQEKFATMLEAYISGVGVTNEITRTFTDYLKWVPEKYRNLQQLSYVDENGKIQNVFLDAKAVEFFNRWYENPSLPSLSTSPERQRFMNVSADDGTVIRVSIKEVNDREKEFAQDAEEQLHTDQRLYNTLDENMPAEIKAVSDAQKVVISERGNFLKATEEEQKKIITPDEDRKRRWFERKSRETEAQLAQEYIEKNPEHAHEVIFGDPELIPNDTGIDRATLINTYMATNGITEDKPEWAQLHTNIAINQSMAGTQLALSNDKSYRTYLDALREIEEALELKAATNYAGASVGARERFNSDIQQFLSKELPAVFATEAGSKEREIALKQMFEKARTTFSGNTTGRFLTQMDMEYAKAQKRNTDAFVKWAEKVIKTEAGAKLNAEQQAHLLKISAKAQQALTDIDSKDAGVAVAGALELRKWQLEKQKLMGVAPKKFSLFGDYAPRAMLASPNTLLFANIPSTAINTLITNLAKRGDLFGENKVSDKLIKNEIKRIKAIYGSTAMNLAQMEKPTSPTLLHGEKYSASGQKWYDPYTILGREDNLFRVPTFVNTLARIASKDAKATGRSADEVFLEYIKLNDQSDSAKLARKQALAVANMAVFTQNGALARCLNHIRSELNYLSRAPLGLDPHGFGLGSLIAPFLSTGANIAEMGIRGTIAPIVTLTTYAQALRTGKAIDPLRKLALRMDWTYFVFSAVSMALLAALTSDDDEFYIDPYKAGMGYDPDRPYDSINIGGVWVDIDFFGPFAIPMRTAAKVIQAWKKDNGVGTSLGMGYAESAKSVLGDIPLAESIINNQFEWAMKKPGAFAGSYVYNQGNKLVPAAIKPISRALSRGQGWMLQPFEGTTVGRKFNRNYGFDGQELTSQDLLEMFTIKFQLGPDAQQYLNNILGLQ